MDSYLQEKAIVDQAVSPLPPPFFSSLRAFTMREMCHTKEPFSPRDPIKSVSNQQ